MTQRAQTDDTKARSSEEDVRVFQVRSLQEGLEQIKQELGEQAVILSTRRLSSGMLEIAVGQSAAPPRHNAKTPAHATIPPAQDKPAQDAKTRQSARTPSPSTTQGAQIMEQLKQLQAELRQLRLEQAIRSGHEEQRLGAATWDKGLENLRRTWPSGLIEALGQLRQRLLEVGVEQVEVDALTVAAISTADEVEHKPALIWQVAERIMQRCLRVAQAPWELPAQDDRPQLHVLVGCSGVGKTTLAAKIAAHARYVAELPTTMLAADGYRIGGLYQLRAYGELIEVPVVSATSPEQLRQAVRVLEPGSFVVVDTCGSWSAQEAVAPSFWPTLHDVAQVHIHTVFAVTASAGQVMHQARALGVSKPSSVILTHSDELWAPGPAFSMLYRMALPVSLISSGRQVPEALDVFDPEGFVKTLLGNA